MEWEKELRKILEKYKFVDKAIEQMKNTKNYNVGYVVAWNILRDIEKVLYGVKK